MHRTGRGVVANVPRRIAAQITNVVAGTVRAHWTRDTAEISEIEREILTCKTLGCVCGTLGDRCH
jgi:hypothetical protein